MGMASFQIDEELFDGSSIRLKAELNQEESSIITGE